jgi:5-methyltetrahydrofolate--homocysteine methyltransferase
MVFRPERGKDKPSQSVYNTVFRPLANPWEDLMHATLEKLIAGGPVVTDGAWGTQLQQRGLPVGQHPDGWNLDHAGEVEAVARAYVEAGSQVILTNTFGANHFILGRHQLADRAAEINRAGVQISCRAAAGRAKVFASMGPTGIMLMMGEVSEDDVQVAFAEQARAMADAGADGIVVETMSDPAEARLAVAAAKETGLPVVACMTFDSGAKKDRTMMGTTPEQAAEALLGAGADCVGANCGQGIAGYVEICRRLHAAGGGPVWIKANAGLPEARGDKAVYAQTPEQFADFVPQLVQAGAGFLGGCCGTTPDFIRAVRKRLAQA